ncbi:MAG: tRNA pseudouridine(55) synthase TruB [Ruminococcaceae bacterium]|nr:tRNA pseudouridine(55) synthase TruB [Oscillospiraceae bacterium]
MQGFLLLKKPQGITSFAAVARVKRLCNEKRVGHTGTLDPMATGVLPVFLGRATALCSLLLDGNKRYKATVKLGVITDTDDITGEIIKEQSVGVTDSELNAVLQSFLGKIMQVPPMYSALKKDGKRLYELARKGEKIDIPAREVKIYSIDLLQDIDEQNTFVIDVAVSKGTYIRALARDIGEKLGCGATLTALERTATCGFDIADCVDLEMLDIDNIGNYIVSEEKAVSHLRECNITEKQAIRFCNGGQLGFERLRIGDFFAGELVRVKCNGVLLGIGIADTENSQLNIKCILNYYNKAVTE